VPKPFLFAIFLLTCFVCTTGHAKLIKDLTMQIDGYMRTYDVFVPDHPPLHPMPLVLLLHGHFGSADVMTGENGKKAPYKIWLTIAEREGVLLVIPDGELGSDRKRGWNDCRANAGTNPPSDDVKFLTALVDDLGKQYRIDNKKVFVHGTSNGGNMAYRLALESGDRFAAIAAVVAALPEKNECHSKDIPVSVLIMNGTDDPLLPYAGGGIGKKGSQKEERGSVVSTELTAQYWVKHNGISAAPQEYDMPDANARDDSTTHVRYYKGGQRNTEVIWYEVRGGGHTEPSLTEHYGRLYRFVVGNQNKDFEMAEEVWKFFKDKTRQ